MCAGKEKSSVLLLLQGKEQCVNASSGKEKSSVLMLLQGKKRVVC